MSRKESVVSSVELIDEQTTFTLIELCRVCAVDAELVETLVEQGILEPINKQTRQWVFSAESIKRTRVTVRLKQDLGVNLAGAALALELLERIEALESQLSVLSK